MRAMGRNPTEDEIMQIMNEIDVDHNGNSTHLLCILIYIYIYIEIWSSMFKHISKTTTQYFCRKTGFFGVYYNDEGKIAR